MDQFAAMRSFIGVVETGTFSRASTVLRVPKPTLTKQIQTLEAHLRTKLLNRTTRRVTVTPDGAAYYERAVRLMADLEELDSSMAVSQAKPQGRLRVDVSSTLATQIIIPALPDFHARYPDILIDLGVSDQEVDLMAENVDCVVRAGPLSDLSLVARRIGEMQFGIYATPTYIARHGVPTQPLDLTQTHHIVGYFNPRQGRAMEFHFTSAGGELCHVTGRYILAVSDGNAYITAGLNHLGVLPMPRFMAKPYLESGVLVEVLADWTMAPKPLHVVFPPSRHLSNRLRVFVDWISELMATPEFGFRG
ncbi:LysR family transcriptional regulator [Azorhizobium oxalatiphilum]|uniref:LysR family transcriptional regulator n=1 Tax=Azorhizobium oxalatiphilum TaxID=980631 RepID=A0A917BSJ7_9HYPH|nr:LysR family transcriptional regulator [Azorhizobium oxalatiphilum]GGF57387.1 LysR family transcriptional regulator [Azorhizobium oxalatiphilum]